MYKNLFVLLDSQLDKERIVLAIEGGSASGKTTLAELLRERYNATVFHTDDFFLQPHQRTPERLNEVGGNLDRERFLNEVLFPLKEGREVAYRKFDCSTMSLCDPEKITPKNLVIIEGAYSMHPDLREFYDFSVFLDIDKDLQKERVLKRNPDRAQRFFEEWIPLEDRYFSQLQIKENCDMVIDIR